MIPFIDINKEIEIFRSEIISKINNILFNAQFILGEEVSTFEATVAELFQINYAVGVGSGTDALFLALKACNIGKGDKVITTPYSFIAPTEAIVNLGAIPVYVDINPDTFNMDENKVEEKIDDQTKAIIVTHLYGNPCNMDKFIEIANKYNLKLIEDCTQAFGSKYNDKYVGSFGDAGCFSFSPNATLGAYGDAGLVVTNSDEIFRNVLLLRNHGYQGDEHIIHGFNSRLDTIQAAILNVKIAYLSSFLERRRKAAKLYKTLLSNIEEIILPIEDEKSYHTYNLFTIRVKKRDELKKFLTENGIETKIFYKKTIPEQPCMKEYNIAEEDYIIAKNISNKVISLPLSPHISEANIKIITNKIKEFYESN